MRELLGPRDPEVAALLLDKSGVYLWKDELTAAERTARQAVDIYATTLPKLHPDRTYAQVQLGEALRLQGRLDEAAVVLKDALVATRAIYGEDNRRVADVLDSLAKIRRAQHDLAEAEGYAQSAVEIAGQGRGSRLLADRLLPHLAGLDTDRASRSMRKPKQQLRDCARHLQRPWAPIIRTSQPQSTTSARSCCEPTADGRRGRLHGCDEQIEARQRARVASGPLGQRSGRNAVSRGPRSQAEPYLVNSYRTLIADKNAPMRGQATARERLVRFYTDRGQSDKLHALIDETRPGTLLRREPQTTDSPQTTRMPPKDRDTEIAALIAFGLSRAAPHREREHGAHACRHAHCNPLLSCTKRGCAWAAPRKRAGKAARTSWQPRPKRCDTS